MSKLLIIYRLFDSSYGPQGNSKTLSVYLREDNTLGYSYYGGWQDSGMGFAISNMQLKKSLPISSSQFKTTKKLHETIVDVLRTGVGSNKISTFEILNEIGTKSMRTKKLSDERKEELMEEVLKSLKKDFEHGDYTVLFELLGFIPDRNLLQSLDEKDWKKFPEVKI